MTRCVVKGCGTKTPPGTQLCERCHVMLSRGVLMQSPAWFATELEFLNTQNYHAMEQVRRLHDKVNELMEEK
jgi:hypothetical protein